MRDWVGNGNSIWKSLGASNHTDNERQEHDYYATEPKAAELLLEVEKFSPDIWECACGEKHLSRVFEMHGYNVRSSDLIDRCGNEVFDFLSMEIKSGKAILLQIRPTGMRQSLFISHCVLSPQGIRWPYS